MPNLIELAKSYVPMLDEVYKLASCTSDLDGAPELARQGANANELIIPMLEMDGLADYDRNGGYVDGDVKMENRTVQCNFDRGRMFTVDTMDNAETAGLAFGRLAAEFIRTKVVPELDAFRFACYAGKPGISSAEATLSSGADVIAAISAAVTEMDENEVPSDQRHLRITSTLLRAIKDMDSYKSREVLESFASVKPVPQRRFYTAIEQLSGKDGEKAGGFRKYGKHYVKCAQGDTGALEVILDSGSVSGAQIKAADVTPVADPAYKPSAGDYVKAVAGAEINFMIVHKPAIIKYDKHIASAVISPDQNQSADAYMSKYRKYGLVDVYANKTAGIYVSHK